MESLSRRDFLKLAALCAGALAFNPFNVKSSLYDDADLVRVASPSVSVFKSPNDQSGITRTWERDALINVYEEVTAQTPVYNPVWYRVWGGYMHRAHLQTVKMRYNEPVSEIPEGRQLAEITVPYSQSLRFLLNGNYKQNFRLYYESVHWVVGVDEGPDGQPWYRILDELYGDLVHYHVPAQHMRLILPEEYTPLSPGVPADKKRIEVDLSRQRVIAYEYDKPVFETTVSTGLPTSYTPPGEIPTITPTGKFNVMVKLPSKHMGDGNLASDIEAYELPGVAWTTFFTRQGHAFHSTFWHNNFGSPMSHGCVNMRTTEARWIFRWCTPSASYEQIDPTSLDKRGQGTRIDIF